MIAAVVFFIVFSAGLELHNLRMNKVLRGTWQLDYIKEDGVTVIEELPEIHFTFAADNTCLLERVPVALNKGAVPDQPKKSSVADGNFSHGKCTYQDRDFFFEFDRVKGVPYSVVPFRVIRRRDNEFRPDFDKIMSFAGGRREFDHLVLTDRATGRDYYFRRTANAAKNTEERKE